MRAVTVNGQLHPLPTSPTTVADLLRDLAFQGKRIAVELNGDIVPRSRYAETVLAPGDKLEIVAAVGGG
jgi:sulfur carrier protein